MATRRVMETKRIHLIYPPDLVREPVIYRVAKTYHLVPNIRKARVTETQGEILLELTGKPDDLQAGVTYMAGLGITVEEIG